MARIFIQKMVELLKPNESEVFVKNRAFLIREGVLMKRVSEAYR
jgi:hypothetical protein